MHPTHGPVFGRGRPWSSRAGLFYLSPPLCKGRWHRKVTEGLFLQDRTQNNPPVRAGPDTPLYTRGGCGPPRTSVPTKGEGTLRLSVGDGAPTSRTNARSGYLQAPSRGGSRVAGGGVCSVNVHSPPPPHFRSAPPLGRGASDRPGGQSLQGKKVRPSPSVGDGAPTSRAGLFYLSPLLCTPFGCLREGGGTAR